MTPLKLLAAAALLLVLLFVGPIVYKTGERVALYLNCAAPTWYRGEDVSCWTASGVAVMHGGRLPRR